MIEKTPPLSIIIPAFNEENAIALQLNSIRNVLEPLGIDYEIIVVDDGSKDRTAQRAQEAGARLLRHIENRGYGASLKTGIQAANYDLIAIIDADGTYPTEAIPPMLEISASADMVVGARIGKEVHIPFLRRLAKWFLHLLAAQIAEQKIPDLNSGLRVFRKECIQQYFPILSNRFSFTTTSTLAYLADNYVVSYYPINYHQRIGQSKIVPWNFMDFSILIIRMSMMFNPLKVFTPLAVLFGSLGVAKTIYDILAVFARSTHPGIDLLLQPVLSTSAVLLLFVGLQFMMIGMVADGVVRRIAQASRPLVPSQGIYIHQIEHDSGDKDLS
jgi:glycosyltransferase involved in cell wall biosynthesis